MKSIFDYKNIKGVSVVCLINKKTKEYCGKIIVNWSNNPNGSVATACVILFNNNPIKQDFFNSTGVAGGYGYDKLSSSIYDALRKINLTEFIKVEPCSGNQRNAFEEAGFEYLEIL